MPDATCRCCEATFHATRPDRVFCSTGCRRNHGYRQRRTAGGERQTKTCAWCDKTYTTSRRSGRYCSNHCARYGSNPRTRLVIHLKWRQCTTCGWWRCHGNVCPRADAHPHVVPPDVSPRACPSCGTPFTPARPAGYFAIYCSKQCSRREAHARRRAAGGHARQVRTDRVVGLVRRHAIYERDNWRCQLCGRKVNPKLNVPHPMAATLDHIVPVSLGGQHEDSNLQLAHFGCNSKKRNKVNGNGEQLRFGGLASGCGGPGGGGESLPAPLPERYGRRFRCVQAGDTPRGYEMPSPIPKPASSRQRRNKTSTHRRLEAVHDVQPPKLPSGRKWHKQTREWWRDVWASPMAPEYDESDNHGLFLLAVLVDDFWQQPTQQLAAEIRLQRQCFGLTPIDRRRLQWEIDRGDSAAAKTQKRRAATLPKPEAVEDDPRRLLA